ncbi:MAG: Gfo/Idh/MocA family oxidoreductase [Chloroflexi bacterium]|nr:Gfo/Idh/MocA family oxidoreductase [Chloroflexota bacterium]
MDTVGVGLIGVGFGGRAHLPALQHLEGAQVIGIAASRLDRAQAVAQPLGVEAYDDYRRLLDRPDVQLASISAPAPFHHDMVVAALERGKHVLCEKPFATSLSEAQDMVARAEAAGVVHAIDFEFRYLAPRQQMKALIDAGYVGQPRAFGGAVLNRGRANPDAEVLPWSVERTGMGGPLGAVGVHVMDAACWLLGGEVASASARLDTFFERRKVQGGQILPATCDDVFTATLRFKQPAVASILCSFVAGPGSQRLEVYGDQGSLIVTDHSTVLGQQAGAKLEPLPIEERFRPAGGWAPSEGSFQAELSSAYAELAGRVIAKIQGRDAGEFPTFADGLRSQRLVDAVYRSADSGQTVALA